MVADKEYTLMSKPITMWSAGVTYRDSQGNTCADNSTPDRKLFESACDDLKELARRHGHENVRAAVIARYDS